MSVSAKAKKQGNLFADNLRRVVGSSYVLADGLYGYRSHILAKGYQAEMDAIKEKYPDSYLTHKDYDRLDQKKKAEIGEMKGMGLWAGGGAVMALFGNRPAAKEMKALSNKLAAYLQAEGVDIKGEALGRALEEKNQTLFSKVADFAYRYPSEIMHTCFALGSLGVINAGLPKYGKDGEKDQGFDLMTLGQGVVVLLGALIGMFVKEKTPEQLAKLPPAKNGFEQAGRFLHQYANKLTSGLYLANNGFSAVRTYNDYKNFNQTSWAEKNDSGVNHSNKFHNVWQIRATALGVYLFGAATLAMTSKTSGVKTDGNNGFSPHDQIYKEAAEMLTTMPDTVRDQYIRKTAEYLSTRRELGMTQLDATEIAEKINQSLNQMQQATAKTDSNWGSRVNQPGPATPGQGIS